MAAPIVPSPPTPTLRIPTAAILLARRPLDQPAGRRELLLRQPDVRVAPEALREDARRLDRRRPVEVAHHGERPDREAPRPPLLARIVLGDARDLDDPEQRLPDGRVEDGELARLERRALGRGVPGDVLLHDV